MSHLERATTHVILRARSALRAQLHRASTESGEGVISAAIVVLIMALIGAAMWAAFSEVFRGAEQNIESQVDQIQW